MRLAPENAETLFALVEEQGVLNTTVKVMGDLRVALARPSQRAATKVDRDDVPRRRYGAPEYRNAEPKRPRNGEMPPQYYVQPYGGSYSARRPLSPYAAPFGYYEPQPYPRYYRW